MHRAVLAGRWSVGRFLQIVGHHQRGHTALANRNANGAVHQMPDLCRHAGLVNEGSDRVLEHADDINFLLIMPTDSGARLLSRDRKHRHVIQPRIVQSCDQMRGARPRSGDAHAQLASEFSVS
jgi:hypothetical protein